MNTKIGRPLKYASLIEKLESDVLYSAASIAEFARSIGMVGAKNPDLYHILRRIRSSCGYIIKKYAFPIEGDGQVIIPGQRPTPGWLGSRWKEAVHENRKQRRNHRLKAKRRKKKKRKEGAI